MIYTTIDNFYVTEEQLANSPSRSLALLLVSIGLQKPSYGWTLIWALLLLKLALSLPRSQI